MNKKPFWLRKELADLKAMGEASKHYQPPIMSLEEIERLRGKLIMKSLRGMISLWLGLNLMDLITTLIALEQGHSEGTLIMANLGRSEFIVYKVVLTVAVPILLIRIKKSHLLKWLCLGMGIVVIWNLIWVIIG